MPGGGNDRDFPQSRLHQGGKRIIYHGLVIDAHELLADAFRQRVKPCAGTSGQDDADPVLHGILSGKGS